MSASSAPPASAARAVPHPSWRGRAGGGYTRNITGFEQVLLKSSEVARELDLAIILTIDLFAPGGFELHGDHLKDAWTDTLWRQPCTGIQKHGASWNDATWVYPGYERESARAAWHKATFKLLPSHEAVMTHMERSLARPYTNVYSVQLAVHASAASAEHGGKHTLTLLIWGRHAVIDGRAALVVLHEYQAALLDVLQAPAGRAASRVWGEEVARLPISMDAAVHDAYRGRPFTPAQMAEGEAALLAQASKMGTPHVQLPLSRTRRGLDEPNVKVRHVITVGETKRVLAATRRARLNLTPLVMACAAWAMREHQDAEAKAATTHYVVDCVVDRRRFVPPTNTVSMGVVSEMLSAPLPQTSVLGLARALQGVQAVDLSVAAPVLEWGVRVNVSAFMNALRPPMRPDSACLSVSNIGVLDSVAPLGSEGMITPVDIDINVGMSTGMNLMHLWCLNDRLHFQSTSAWHDPDLIDAWLDGTVDTLLCTANQILSARM